VETVRLATNAESRDVSACEMYEALTTWRNALLANDETLDSTTWSEGRNTDRRPPGRRVDRTVWDESAGDGQLVGVEDISPPPGTSPCLPIL